MTGVVSPGSTVKQGSLRRVIADLTASGVNDACLCDAKVTYEGLESVVAAAQHRVRTE